MNDLTIARAFASLAEPDETLRAAVQNRRPSVFDAEMFYVWVESSAYGSEDTGESDRHQFQLTAAWLTAEGTTREVEVSEVIDDMVADLVAMVRANRAYSDGDTTYWEWLQAEQVDYESPTTNDARGFELTVTGYLYEGS